MIDFKIKFVRVVLRTTFRHKSLFSVYKAVKQLFLFKPEMLFDLLPLNIFDEDAERHVASL